MRLRRIPDEHVRWGTFLRMWKKRRPPHKPKVFPTNLDAYARQVILYYDGTEHRELKEITGERYRVVRSQEFGKTER